VEVIFLAGKLLRQERGQGSLELLLIVGAVLALTAIVVFLAFEFSKSGSSTANTSLEDFNKQVQQAQ